MKLHRSLAGFFVQMFITIKMSMIFLKKLGLLKYKYTKKKKKQKSNNTILTNLYVLKT